MPRSEGCMGAGCQDPGGAQGWVQGAGVEATAGADPTPSAASRPPLGSGPRMGAMPGSILPMSPQVSELGLEGDILPVPGDHPASRNRFLYARGALHKLPSGLGGLLRPVPPFSRALFWSGLRDLLAPASTQPDETVHAFVCRRFGEEVADIAVDSLCRGVFAGDCRALSVRSCFPALFEAERHRRSVLLGLVLGRGETQSWGGHVWGATPGMQVPGGDTPALSPAVCWDLGGHPGIAGCAVVTADHVVSAIPAGALAEVLPAEAEPLARELRHIPAVAVAVVNLQYEGAKLPVTGFGHLVPSSEDSSLLGIVYDSVAFPEHNRSGAASLRLTVMLGGAWFTQSFGDPAAVAPSLLLRRAQDAVRAHLGLEAAPSHSIVKVHKACIPQYTLGHWRRTESIGRYLTEQGLPLSLVGASYAGVSVNDCIASAKAAVSRLLGQPC
nr:PREDICTED: protoporphyrinogen oxidase-like [Apteryx mantelli mantelli]